MNEYYENGPEGMPRVERMTDSTIMAVLSQKNVPTIYVHSEQDYASLRLFAHAIAEETLARVPSWPAERTTSPVSQMTDERIDRAYAEAYGYNPGDVLVGAFDRKFARAVLAAAGKVPAYPSQSCDEACYYQCTEAGAITPKCVQPVANAIIRDIAELEYDGSEGAMLVTEADLRLIVDRHVLAATAPHAQAPAEQQERVHPVDLSKLTRHGPVVYSGFMSVMERGRGSWVLIEDVEQLLAAAPAALVAEPVVCSTCNGAGVVDDGEIDCYSNGEPFVCGPVKCVKDCPVCAARPQPVTEQREITFDRRWSLARDGFGLERNDETGEYVAHDDAIAVLHAALAKKGGDKNA